MISSHYQSAVRAFLWLNRDLVTWLPDVPFKYNRSTSDTAASSLGGHTSPPPWTFCPLHCASLRLFFCLGLKVGSYYFFNLFLFSFLFFSLSFFFYWFQFKDFYIAKDGGLERIKFTLNFISNEKKWPALNQLKYIHFCIVFGFHILLLTV